MSYEQKLKKQVHDSITRVFKQSLSDIELVLCMIEAIIDKHPEIKEDGSPEFIHLENLYAAVRKRTLGVGNGEIRRLHAFIDEMSAGKTSNPTGSFL